MDTQVLPVFAFAEEKQQAQELRTFLREKGADLSPNGLSLLFSSPTISLI